MENARAQVARALELLETSLASRSSLASHEVQCELHSLAMVGLLPEVGQIRTDDVLIRGSRHEPPPWATVPALLAEMYNYLNARPGDAIHEAAYAVWRINWIHPFAPDGNGRVARAVGLVLLFFRLGRMPPAKAGQRTFLHRLTQRKLDYNDALEAADRAHVAGLRDVSQLEKLLEDVLSETLKDYLRE